MDKENENVQNSKQMKMDNLSNNLMGLMLNELIKYHFSLGF